MPLTDTEVSRLADSAAALRPDWPARSIRAYLSARMRDRAFADVAVALACVAADPASQTPARLDEAGPWWAATKANRPHDSTWTPGPGAAPACRRPGHERELASNCRACASEHLAAIEPAAPAPTVPAPVDQLRAALRRPAQEVS